MGLLQDARKALDNLANLDSKVAAAVQVAQTVVTPSATTSMPQSQIESTSTTATASPAAVTSPAQVPAATGILGEVENVVQELAPVADLIPGAHNIAALLTVVVQLTNVVESVVNDMKTHSPIAWAQIANTFSSAVQDYEAIPKA
jgi:hypothetical protein